LINPFTEEQSKLFMAVLLVLDSSAEPTRHDEIVRRTGTGGKQRRLAVYDAMWGWQKRGVIQLAEPIPGDAYVNSNPLWRISPVGEMRADAYRRELAERVRENEVWWDTRSTWSPTEEVNPEFRDNPKQIAFHYHSTGWFSTWTPVERLLTVYSAGGQVLDLYGWSRKDNPLLYDATQAAALFGPLSALIYQNRIYPSQEN
jgi:hypothetical protein